jgi:2,3-bisphosphoglycerate-independent phosphoglycerate mutase
MSARSTGTASTGRRILLILLDGVADRAYAELGDLTPLEAASTPNLDRLASTGVSGSVYPLEPGLVPPSELPHFHLFGYARDPFPGRAVLEALGRGVDVPVGGVVTHAGLRHVVTSANGFAIERWWARDEDDHECASLIAAVGTFEADGVAVASRYLDRGDAVVTLDGGSAWVTDSDPFFFTGLPVIRVEPLDDAPDPEHARRTAHVLNAFLLRAHGVLEAHPVNTARRARGARPLNMLVTKWTGRRSALPPFARRTGLPGAIIASTEVYAGLAALLDMRFIHVAESGSPDIEIAAKLHAAREAFEAGAEFVHLHTKAADEAAHTASPGVKRDVIAAIDAALEGLWRWNDVGDLVVAVTADHATPSRGPMLHSGDAVPLVIAAPTIRRDGVARFGERPAIGGGLGWLRACDVMPLLLNAADRARFLGGRPTPDAGLGVPRITPLLPGSA